MKLCHPLAATVLTPRKPVRKPSRTPFSGRDLAAVIGSATDR